MAVFQSACGKFFTSSTSSGGGGNSGSAFVYAAGASGLYAFSADLTSGKLTTLSGSPYAIGASPDALAIDPHNKLLYVGGASGLNAFGINSNGTLSTISLSTGTLSAMGIAINPGGTALYVLDGVASTITGFTITNGKLAAITGGQIAVSGTPSSLVIDPAGAHLYAAEGSAGIVTATINSNGTLTENSNIVAPPAGASFTKLAITPSGRNLYAATIGGVVVFSFDANGVPTPLGGTQTVVATSTNPSALAVDPAGNFLFVANNDTSNVSAFIVLSNGALSPVAGSPFSAGSAPTGIAVNATSKYVFVATSQGVQSFGIDASTPGKLNSIGTINAGNNPAVVASTH
ncbi:MAG TPA: YncE family protein [Terriglobales bacterium]